jgi:hypothetical protein
MMAGVLRGFMGGQKEDVDPEGYYWLNQTVKDRNPVGTGIPVGWARDVSASWRVADGSIKTAEVSA